MLKRKKILILGASDFQLPAILKAKEMGLVVGVADINPNAVGVPYADKFYCVSTIDEEGVLKAAIDFKADGVVTLCTDMPMRALAYTCEKLNLIGLDYSSAVKATDKAEMIKIFEQRGVPHPRYVVVENKETFAIDNFKLSYPVVTKPTDNSGSRGVMYAQNKEQLLSAIEYSSTNSRSGAVIIEEYMVGHEVSVEIMVINGISYILQITDKLTTGSPHFVEIGHSQPSKLNEDEKNAIADIASRASTAIGIKNGPAHAEIILTSQGPKMVEIGARMGGGCITTHLVPLSTGIDMTKATIQIALGEEPDISNRADMASAIRFIIPPNGVIKRVDGENAAKAIPGIKTVEIQCVPGQVLTKLENGSSRIGYVIAQAKTASSAIEICNRALEKIKIIT